MDHRRRDRDHPGDRGGVVGRAGRRALHHLDGDPEDPVSQPARTRRGAQAGMTLIELMIAMVILGIVVATAFQIAFTIMNSYKDHRRAMAVERSARGAISVLSDAVRNTSPGVD